GDDKGSADGGAVEILLPFPEGLPLAPATVAKEKGYFEDNGLDGVKISVADGSGYLGQQLVAGNVNFALMGSSDVAVAASKRDDVRVLFCHQANNVYRIGALAETGITDLEGLAGKTLGITEPGGGENTLVKAALDEAGLTDKVTTLPIGGSGPQSLSAIKNGKVQAYASSYPDFVAFGAEGIEFTDITPEKYSVIPGTCMTTTQEFLDTDEGKEQAEAVTTAWIQAETDTINDPEGTFELICGAVPSACENEEAAQRLFDDALEVMKPDTPDARIADTTPEVWATLVEVLSRADLVPADLDMSDKVAGGTVGEIRDAAYENVG
ncbi:MAG: ABC transporter substrate-binding protein, partial [Nocardioides sp.]|nr:ABC transporter substrate-binding protein [Nocardioides sp.]